MSIHIELEALMESKKISMADLARTIEISPADLSILKSGKARAIRMTTLNKLCKALSCTPSDILKYTED